MQQNQQERRFGSVQQQPMYRFPQNQQAYGWQPQQSFPPEEVSDNPPRPSGKKVRMPGRSYKKRRRFLTLWNLFAIIGIVDVLVQMVRYIVIPLLIYLHTLTGGAL